MGVGVGSSLDPFEPPFPLGLANCVSFAWDAMPAMIGEVASVGAVGVGMTIGLTVGTGVGSAGAAFADVVRTGLM